MLLSWMFISSYTTIWFFSVNTIFEYLYKILWLRSGPSITYATEGSMDGEGLIQNVHSCVKGEEVSRTHLHHLFSLFGSIFVLYSVLFHL